MRITNTMMANNVISNLNKNTVKLVKAQEVVATEKVINRPSDDPIGMSNILSFRSELSAIQQYTRNIVQGKMRIEVSETALDAIDGLVRDAKEIAVSLSTVPGDSGNRAIMASSVQDIHDQVLQLANSQFEGYYLFAGTESDKPAFSADGTYDGNSGDIYLSAEKNARIKINASGDELFTISTGVNVFSVLDDLKDALEVDPYIESTVFDQVTLLNDVHEQIDFVRSQMSTKFKRLEGFESQLAAYKNKFEELLSIQEDANMPKAIIDMQQQETAYEVSLATSGRIFQKSVIDFIG